MFSTAIIVGIVAITIIFLYLIFNSKTFIKGSDLSKPAQIFATTFNNLKAYKSYGQKVSQVNYENNKSPGYLNDILKNFKKGQDIDGSELYVPGEYYSIFDQ